LKHGGRVSGAAAAMGTALQIKPLLHVDSEGKLQAVEKPRGRNYGQKYFSGLKVIEIRHLS